ncbi:hypothetical protein HD554DRAFT_2323915 [Boletus coccyginus]|nr:hypothetical protein HD554DRAFT_2323915 [Boletus coccyginus]
MSAGKTDILMDILASLYEGQDLPFRSHDDLYTSIDAIPYGECPWQSFSVKYLGLLPMDPLSWMLTNYDVWYCDPLSLLEQQFWNPEFAGAIDYAAKVVTDENGRCEVCDLMSGQWAWDQSELIAQDPDTHGATFAPIVLGSDKTMVSVSTGNTEYYPLYISLGNVHNNVHRSHGGAVSILAFLSIPKTDPAHKDDVNFRHFHHQLFHSSLAAVLRPVRDAMIKPRVTRCADGHFRRVIYGLGPYIADYPEQALLGCIVQGWCTRCTAQNSDLDSGGGPRAHAHTHFPHVDIHELIAPDLLHQLIKGTFKDHLVTWVQEYLEQNYPKQRVLEIIAEIDHRLAAVPLFPGLRRFPEGRGFKQWTGDDSKALMKIYLPAITGLVPDAMVRAITAFLDFCYIARKSVINERDLDTIDDAVRRFHLEQQIFKEVGVRQHFSLPRQHSMVHYRTLIEMFGVPNGLCSSITESWHIKAVKEPWHRSNRYEALGQMLLTNQRLDKLAAARLVYSQKGMLDGPSVPPGRREDITTVEGKDGDEDDDSQAVKGDKSDYNVRLARKPVQNIPRASKLVAAHYGYPELIECIRHYLYDQHNPNAGISGDRVDLCHCPSFEGNIRVFNCASATYFAPSDHSGCGGMHHNWRGGSAHYDCVFVDNGGSDDESLSGLLVAHVLLFFSFRFQGCSHSYPLTGMWIVVPEVNAAGCHVQAVISVKSILQGAHLIGVFGAAFLPVPFHFSSSLDAFNAYYVNRYIDHHSYALC